MTKYKLGLCEIHNKYIHGFCAHRSDPLIKGHYICHYIYKYNDYEDPISNNNDDIFENDDEEYLINRNNYGVLEIFMRYTKPITDNYFPAVYNREYKKQHDFIRNYKNIIINEKYLTPEIMEIHRLRGDEHIAILKTFWLRCIQRCWKRLVDKRKEVLKLRKQLNTIKYKEINGIYPEYCVLWPSVKGMWYYSTRR